MNFTVEPTPIAGVYTLHGSNNYAYLRKPLGCTQLDFLLYCHQFCKHLREYTFGDMNAKAAFHDVIIETSSHYGVQIHRATILAERLLGCTIKAAVEAIIIEIARIERDGGYEFFLCKDFHGGVLIDAGTGLVIQNTDQEYFHSAQTKKRKELLELMDTELDAERF